MVDLKTIKEIDPELYDSFVKEFDRQQYNLELIASENIVSPAVMAAMGTFFTNKYAEGYPGNRYYGGCQFVDIAENIARDRLKQLFGAEHANVQPHSGASANFAVFEAVLQPGDTVLSMSLDGGGHLSHGSKVNFSGKWFNIVGYGVTREEGLIDYDEVERLAVENKPKLIVAGASAYPRIIDFKRFREIADKVGAYLMVDMAHIAGLVAAGEHPSPVPFADFVTSTTHKTLRGPRGGIILCKEEYAKTIDKAVFPGTQGGPLMHIIAAKAVAFKEALSPEFKAYQHQIILNCKKLAETFRARGINMVSGGTDNHLILVNLLGTGVSGKELTERLDNVHITVNKNSIPFDPAKPTVTSGIRVGTACLTTRGMKEDEMVEVGNCIADILEKGEAAYDDVNARVRALAEKYPIYKNDVIF